MAYRRLGYGLLLCALGAALGAGASALSGSAGRHGRRAGGR